MKHKVAIVGRPNVGKSTFFNRIIGRRLSIVQDEPGVTRDRIKAECEWCGHVFDVYDTGGIDVKGEDVITRGILSQAREAIKDADVIVFMVDGREGLTSADEEVASLLRKSKKPVILTVNKLDNFEIEKTYEFYSLGLGEPVGISASQPKGIGDLLDIIVSNFNEKNENADTENLKIAIVGKPNVGKSSLVNKLSGTNRVIVSDIAGTTRDAVDVEIEYKGERFTLIDTAGLRRKRSVEAETVEKFSNYRAIDSIERADIVLVVIDASEPLSEQDVKICGLVHEANKPSIIVMNKWDKVAKDEKTMREKERLLNIDLAFMKYFKSVYISAQTGARLDTLFEAILKVRENNTRKLSTGTLNDILENAVISTPAPSRAGKQLKIKYMTQTGICPPNFVLFVNNKDLMTDSYARFIENSIRNAVDFSGTPIKIVCKNSSDK